MKAGKDSYNRLAKTSHARHAFVNEFVYVRYVPQVQAGYTEIVPFYNCTFLQHMY